MFWTPLRSHHSDCVAKFLCVDEGILSAYRQRMKIDLAEGYYFVMLLRHGNKCHFDNARVLYRCHEFGNLAINNAFIGV